MGEIPALSRHLARLDLRSSLGRTALEWAEFYNKPKYARWLRFKMAKANRWARVLTLARHTKHAAKQFEYIYEEVIERPRGAQRRRRVRAGGHGTHLPRGEHAMPMRGGGTCGCTRGWGARSSMHACLELGEQAEPHVLRRGAEERRHRLARP